MSNLSVRIKSLEKQLSDAKSRETALLKVIEYYADEKASDTGSHCPKCFEISPCYEVKRCQSCSFWECEKCIPKNVHILRCVECKRSLCSACNACDISKSQTPEEWVCLGCQCIENIKEECASNLELLLAEKITRSQAIVAWSVKSKFGYSSKIEAPQWVKVASSFLRSSRPKLIMDDWAVFLGDDAELQEDFPDANKYDLIIIPDYSECPKSVGLAKLVARKFFPGNQSVWFDMIDYMSTENELMARKTFTVKELVKLWKDGGEPGDFSKEEYASAANREFLDRMFE